jgi:hypothetical protein
LIYQLPDAPPPPKEPPPPLKLLELLELNPLLLELKELPPELLRVLLSVNGPQV